MALLDLKDQKNILSMLVVKVIHLQLIIIELVVIKFGRDFLSCIFTMRY